MEKAFVYGAGGHGKVVIDAIESGPGPYAVAFVVDDNPELHGRLLRGHPIRPSDAIGEEPGIVAIGAAGARISIAARYRGRLIRVVHPQAWIARGVELGDGTMILAGAIVNSDAVIGENVIVNTAATIDHDCVIEDGVHVAPGCHLCGNVRVGARTLIGIGTVVTPGVRIGRNVIVKAGSRITRDVPDGADIAALEPVC